MPTTIPQPEEAFHGLFTDHHAFLLASMLTRIDQINADIAALGARIEAEIAPFASLDQTALVTVRLSPQRTHIWS